MGDVGTPDVDTDLDGSAAAAAAARPTPGKPGGRGRGRGRGGRLSRMSSHLRGTPVRFASSAVEDDDDDDDAGTPGGEGDVQDDGGSELWTAVRSAQKMGS